jgi:hypothetical protein
VTRARRTLDDKAHEAQVLHVSSTVHKHTTNEAHLSRKRWRGAIAIAFCKAAVCKQRSYP